MKKQYTKLLILFILIIILITLFIYTSHKSQILKNAVNSSKKEIIKDISFNIYSYENEKMVVLVTAEDSENKIKQLTYNENGKEKTINTNLKEKIAIDYEILNDGEYTFKAINGLGETIEKTLVVDDNTKENLIKINTKSDKELGTKLDVNIDFKDGNKNTYKIGNNTEWIEYKGDFSITSYDIIEKNCQDNENEFTIYAKSEDVAKNRIIISKQIASLDLKMQNKPIITIEKSNEYPVLTKNGVSVLGTINIQYDANYETENYYSLDKGNTWQKYTGTIIASKDNNTTSGTILAKSIKKISGLENQSEQEMPLAENSLDLKAYDGDPATEIKGGYGSGNKVEQYLSIDESAYLREYEIIQNTKDYVSGGMPYMTLSFYDNNKKVIGEEYTYQNVGNNYKTKIVCPYGAKYLKFGLYGASGWGGRSACYLKEISVAEDNNVVLFQKETIYPLIEENGVTIPENATIYIRYPDSYKKHYYKIGENSEWISCEKNIKINARVGDEIYTKGTDTNENEQNENIYTVRLAKDTILQNAYDGDDSTFYLAGNVATKYIEVDKSAWNKKLRILSRGYQIVRFLDKEGNTLYKKEHRQTDTTFIIPENTTRLQYYFNESGGIYEMKIIQ